MKKMASRKKQLLVLFLLLALGLAGCAKDNSSSAPLTPAAQMGTVWPSADITQTQQTPQGLVVTNSAGQVIFTQQGLPIESYKATQKLLVVKYQDRGPRVLVINSNGTVLINGSQVFQNRRGRETDVRVSDEIVAIRFINPADQSPRILAMNAAGQVLIRPDQVYHNADLKLSDHIVALTFENQGMRVLALSSQGAVLVNPSDIYDHPEIRVTNDRISVDSRDRPPFTVGVDRNGRPQMIRAHLPVKRRFWGRR